MFSTFDSDNSGALDVIEFRLALKVRHAYSPPLPSCIADCIYIVSVAHTNTFAALLGMLVARCAVRHAACHVVRQACRQARPACRETGESEGEGDVGEEECCSRAGARGALLARLQEMGLALSEGEVALAMDELDSDGGGTISITECA